MPKREQGNPATEALLTDLGRNSFITITYPNYSTKYSDATWMCPHQSRARHCFSWLRSTREHGPGYTAAPPTAGSLQPQAYFGFVFKGEQDLVLSSTHNPFPAFCHHKEPDIVCPLEQGTNTHLTFPCHTFWMSTSPCRGSRTPIHSAHLTKSCWVKANIGPHELSHQCHLQSLLTWHIHLCLVHCLLTIPNPLPYCLNVTMERHTKAATQGNRELPALKVPHLPRAPPGVMHQQDSSFLCLLPPTPEPHHTHLPDPAPQESQCRQVTWQKGFFPSNKVQKKETLEHFSLFIKKNVLKKLEFLNPQHFSNSTHETPPANIGFLRTTL